MREPHEKSEMGRGGLSAAISKIRSRYHDRGYSDWDVGNGLCERFAHDVLDEWAGDGWVRSEWADRRWGTIETGQLFIYDDDGDACGWDWGLMGRRYPNGGLDEVDRGVADLVAMTGPNHVWIELDGLCYDCEHPDGVRNPLELNFFRRHLDLYADRPSPSP